MDLKARKQSAISMRSFFEEPSKEAARPSTKALALGACVASTTEPKSSRVSTAPEELTIEILMDAEDAERDKEEMDVERWMLEGGRWATSALETEDELVPTR